MAEANWAGPTHTGYDEQNRVAVFLLIFGHVCSVVDNARKAGRSAELNVLDGFLVVIQQFVHRVAVRVRGVIVQRKTVANLEIGRYQGAETVAGELVRGVVVLDDVTNRSNGYLVPIITGGDTWQLCTGNANQPDAGTSVTHREGQKMQD